MSTPLRIVLAVVTLDFLSWAWHLACHRITWLWRFHAVHHSVEHLSVALIPVESVVEERAEESPALRTAIRIGALNVAGHVIERKTRIIPSATTL